MPSPPRPASPGDELVAIVDRDNRVVGSTTRREMRARSLFHRATYLLVFDSRGRVFLQKRTPTKDVFPGCWEPVAGGVVLAGETYEEGAERELAEELGIRDVPLEPLFPFLYEDERNRVWGRAFACTWDGPIVLQPEEVESGEFVEVEEVFRRAAEEPFTPDGLLVLRRYLEERGLRSS